MSCLAPSANRCAGLLAVAIGLAACSATPTHYYTLLPPAAAVAEHAAQDPAFQIEVLPVAIPQQVDVPTMVVRAGSGAVTPVETRRWIAPLDSEIRSALIAALTRRLGVADVSGVAPIAALPLYRIRLSVRRFDSALGAAAQIDAVWTVHAAHDPVRTATCESHVRVPVAPGYEALAEGHQRAVIAVADAIAEALLALQSGKSVSACAAASS